MPCFTGPLRDPCEPCDPEQRGAGRGRVGCARLPGHACAPLRRPGEGGAAHGGPRARGGPARASCTGRSGSRVPLRDPRPRGPPFGEPQCRARARACKDCRPGGKELSATSVRARLTFPEDLVSEPVISRLALDYGVIANIRRANVEENTGWIVCELSGTRESLDSAIEWLTATGIKVDWLGGPVES